MNKVINNIALKITAICLSFLLFFTAIFSLISVVYMLYNNFYTKDFTTLQTDTMQQLTKNEMGRFINEYIEDPVYLNYYYSDKNFLYDVRDLTDGTGASNYESQDYYAENYEKQAINYYYNSAGEKYSEYEVDYFYGDDEYNIKYYDDNKNPLTQETHTVEFTLYIPKNLKNTDTVWLVNIFTQFGFNNRYSIIFMGLASIILCVVIFSYLFVSVGHGNGGEGISVCAFNNLPADILTAITVLCFVFALLILDNFNWIAAYIAAAVLAAILYFVALWYFMSITVQIKAKTLIKHTVLYWIFKRLCKIGGVLKNIYKNLATAYKTALVIVVLFAVLAFFTAVNYYNGNVVILWLLAYCVISVFIMLAAIAFQKVKKGGERIVNGDLDSKIDTKYMYGDIKDFAESLNNINCGLQNAIDDKMRSERFKTELITNVSHDIKTPLTSIVNYVDLIKKEDCDNEKINEYIEVLDRQSNRLKKLIEDLIEASKASTGNLTVQLEKCNLSLLINQAVGEFDEKLESKNLQVVQSLESDDLYIMADGRRLWRVFDNLLNNICKYALCGTRVYINLKSENGKAIITFKNISEQPINMSGEELTERFVRGDRSRNTEGSGLGLSIAKSLTELQNGTLKIVTDADLFKVIITFDLIKE